MATKAKKPRKRRVYEPVAGQLVYRLKTLEKIVDLKRTAILEAVDRDEFPKPIRLSPNAVGWLASEIEAWLRERAAKRKVA